MNAQPPREQFEAELRRHRLPHAYIQRLLAEWDDHVQDLQDERRTDMAGKPDVVKLEQRLGDPAQLAAVAAKQYHKRSFLGRHPILTFLVLPLPLILLCIIAICLSLFGCCYVVYLLAGSPTTNGLNHPYLSSIVLTVFSWLLFVFPPITIALFTCRIARRNNLNWRWACATCALNAVYVGLFQAVCTLPTKPDAHDGQFIMGFGFDSSLHGICGVFLPKLALAIGVGLLLIKRAQRLRKLDENRRETTVFRRAA